MESLNFKPIKPILQPTYPLLPPEQTEVDYRNSKQIDICELAAPEWDKPTNSIDLDWVYVKRELRSVTDYLKKTRANAAVEYQKNNVKWQELQEKEEYLQQSFIKFEQFVLENEDKRRRARRKVVEEKLNQEENTRMLNDALSEQQDLVDVKQKLDQKTREFRIYEDYLNQVVTSDLLHYKNINDVINRYMILMETKDQVSEKRARDMDELDQAKREYGLLLDEKNLAVMMLNSQMVELIVRHDRARSRALQWESIVTEIKDIIEQKHMELIGVKVSMWNMYKQMCARKGTQRTTKELAKEDFEGQLMFIKKTLLELKKVRQVVEKLVAGKHYSGIVRKKHTTKHIKINLVEEPHRQSKTRRDSLQIPPPKEAENAPSGENGPSGEPSGGPPSALSGPKDSLTGKRGSLTESDKNSPRSRPSAETVPDITAKNPSIVAL